MNRSAEATYQCDLCGGTFVKGRSDEEALRETQQHFPHLAPAEKDDMAVVCDDCWNKIHPDRN